MIKILEVCTVWTVNDVLSRSIEIKNNKARHNLMNVKYRQMTLRSVDGPVVGSFLEFIDRLKTSLTVHTVCVYIIFCKKIHTFTKLGGFAKKPSYLIHMFLL